jgi:hypothetical protein
VDSRTTVGGDDRARGPLAISPARRDVDAAHDERRHHGYAKIDSKIDINGRKTFRSGIADRAVAGDLDCDGDVDAIVKLFEISNGHTYTPILTPTEGFWAPVAQYSAGWRYLENVYSASNPNGFWFKDVAPTKMKNVSNRFATTWNRGLGMTTLADFATERSMYDTTLAGFALNMTPVPPVSSRYETYDQAKTDLHEQVGPAGFGVLTGLSAQLLPQLLPDNQPAEGRHRRSERRRAADTAGHVRPRAR